MVPGGGLSPDGTQWIACRPGFFLPVRVLSRLFRRLFLEELVKAFDAGKLEFFSAMEACRDRGAFLRYLAPMREVEWVVYAKRPFAGPEQVLDYVGRYTHRVAISNNRLLDIADGNVTFRYKDYRHDGQQKTMTLHRTLPMGVSFPNFRIPSTSESRTTFPIRTFVAIGLTAFWVSSSTPLGVLRPYRIPWVSPAQDRRWLSDR